MLDTLQEQSELTAIELAKELSNKIEKYTNASFNSALLDIALLFDDDDLFILEENV